MVDQLHVHVHVKPCRRLAEEAVGVSCNVPLAQRSDELGLQACRVERCQVNTCKGVLAKHVSATCGESNIGRSHRRGLEHG
jgi:hypothetical protein